jgi:hypothetical protein
VVKKPSVVVIAVIAILVISPGAGADVLFQSAQNLISGSVASGPGGVETDSTYFSGANFAVTTPVHVTQIGGNFGNLVAIGNNEIFGAIVPVASLSAAPVPADLSSNVLASTLITLPSVNMSADVSGAVSVDLSPGDYGVIFGSGKFGATGSTIAIETINGLQANTAGTQTYVLRQSDGAMFTQAPGSRYFVIVPEPAGATIIAATGVMLSRRRLRSASAR